MEKFKLIVAWIIVITVIIGMLVMWYKWNILIPLLVTSAVIALVAWAVITIYEK